MMARLVVGVGICALAAAAAAPGSDMPKVNIDMGEISVSGICKLHWRGVTCPQLPGCRVLAWLTLN